MNKKINSRFMKRMFNLSSWNQDDKLKAIYLKITH